MQYSTDEIVENKSMGSRLVENAKAGHADPGWRKIIADRYGNEPRISYYEVPTIVDNVMGAVLLDEEYLRACAKERKLA